MHRREPGQERDIGQRVPQDLREHHAETGDWNCHDEHDPEQAAELCDMIAMARVARALLVGGVRVVLSHSIHERHAIPLEGMAQPKELNSQLP